MQWGLRDYAVEFEEKTVVVEIKVMSIEKV